MSKTLLTDAMRDSHKVTLGLHLATAKNAIQRNDWHGAKTAFQLALPHANATGNAQLKREVFAYLNAARAKAKKQANEEPWKIPAHFAGSIPERS